MNCQALRTCSKYLHLNRSFTTSSKTMRRSMEEFKELQRKFQVDDGVPTYLKAGSRDRVIFGFVLIGIAMCGANALYTLNRIIYPKPAA